MKTNVYSLFDVKAAVYGTPFFMQNDSMALRSFSDLVNDRNTMVFNHPEDFTLFGIGEFDDQSCIIEPKKLWVVSTAAALKKPEMQFDFARAKQLIGKDIVEVNSKEEVL